MSSYCKYVLWRNVIQWPIIHIVVITWTWKNNLLREYQSDFRPKDALLFTFYLQSSLLDLPLQWQHLSHKLRQRHNVASYHDCLFSLIVEDHRLWLVDIKLCIFDTSPDLPEVWSTEKSKLWLFVCVTKSSFNHRSLAFSCLFWILWVFAVSHWAFR